MISVSNVSAGAAASGYYRAEGYYIEGSPEAEAASQWFGKGAEDLAARGQAEFAGKVEDAHFSTLLEGHAPPTMKDANGSWIPGRTMGRWVNGEQQHRPGLDLTFSPDKSVSIMALVAGDERVIAAHDAAVKATMAYVEERFVATRRSMDGDIQTITGGKMFAGLFRHDSSRLLDPQLHTHAVVLNMVLGNDGKVTALTNEAIFNNKMLAGEIYKNELHRNLEKTGYEIDRDRTTGAPRIKAVPSELADIYSKRRAEIEVALLDRGVVGTARNSALAALATRARKQGNVDRSELRQAWLKEAEQQHVHESDLQKWRDVAVARGKWTLPGVTRHTGPTDHIMENARAATSQAIDHLRERNAVYTKGELTKAALPRARAADIHAIERIIADKTRTKTLHVVRIDGEDRLTDSKTLAEEKQVLATYRQGQRDRSAGIALPDRHKPNGGVDRTGVQVLAERLAKTTLSPGQQDAVFQSLSGAGRYVGVQGYAGTGKTYAMQTLVNYAGRAGYGTEGLAPTGKAVEALHEAIPESRTIASVLTRFAAKGTRAENKSRSILVVDEASMVSTRDLRDLMTYANAAGYARVVLVGDQQQLDAIGAGTPFKALQGAGLRTALMDDIRRQRDGALRDSVVHAIKGEIHQAFEKLQDVRTTAPDQSLGHAVASAWTQLSRVERDRTGVIVLTNKVRAEVNELIRDQLKNEGRLRGSETNIAALASLNFTRAEAGDAQSFRAGDIIVPTSRVVRDDLKEGHLYRVTMVDKNLNALGITDPSTGKTNTLSLAQASKSTGALRVFEEEPRSIAAGDRVKFTIADKSAGIVTGARGHVETVDAASTQVRLDSGRTATLPLSGVTARGMDHAYASTAHDFQGATVDRIIVGMAATETLATQKSFYVGISRARDDATIVTTDVDGLANRIKAVTGERPQALDAYVETARDRARDLARQDAETARQNVQELRPDQSKHHDQSMAKFKAASKTIEHALAESRARLGMQGKDDLEHLKSLSQKIKEGPTR